MQPQTPSPNPLSQEAITAIFQRARRAYDAGATADALVDFQAVLAAQSSPNALLYVARCQRRLAQYVEAYNSYAQAAREAEQRAQTEGRYVETRDTARAEANALQPNIAFLLFAVSNAPDDAVITTNGERTTRSQWNERIAHAPGRVTIDASANGMQPVHMDVQLSLGQETRVQIPFVGASLNGAVQLQTPPVGFATNPDTVQSNPVSTSANLRAGTAASSSPAQTTGSAIMTPPVIPSYVPRSSPAVAVGAVALGVGIAGLITGSVLEIIAFRRYVDLRSTCGSAGNDCATDQVLIDQIASGRAINYGGVAGIAIGTTMAVVGGAVLFLGLAANETSRMLAPMAQPQYVRRFPVNLRIPTFTLGPDRASVAMSGTF
jgi:hypothetical protein